MTSGVTTGRIPRDGDAVGHVTCPTTSDIVRVAAMSNTAGTLFGRSRGPRHRTTTDATVVEWAAPMHPVDEMIVLLEGGCLS